MAKTVDFPAVDLGAVGIETLNGHKPELLSQGFNARAWKLGGDVVKLSKSPTSPDSAESLLGKMLDEHGMLEEDLGEHMPETRYATVPVDGEEDSVHIAAVQPFIVGETLTEFLGRHNSRTEALEEFLEKCVGVYRARRVMPDIGRVEQGFSVLRNSNVIIDAFSDNAHPVLVDTNFGKIQRSGALGPVWNWQIYRGALRAQKQLRKRS